MEAEVKALFERYQRFFRKGLSGEVHAGEVAAIYAPAFIAASPAGVVVGKNDDELPEVMKQGYAHYRQIGTKDMRIRDVSISSIDEYHCVAHVAWTATYARRGQPDVAIEFDVHYLVQNLNGEPKVFGWISGDEQEVLKRHGIG